MNRTRRDGTGIAHTLGPFLAGRPRINYLDKSDGWILQTGAVNKTPWPRPRIILLPMPMRWRVLGGGEHMDLQ